MAAEPANDGLLLFQELREDLVVELVAGAEPQTTHTFGGGVGAVAGRDARRMVYVGDASPEDLPRIVRALSTDRRSAPELAFGRSDPEAGRSRLSPAEAVERAAHAVEWLFAALPELWVRGRCVGFVQRVRIARPGRPVVEDLRHGWRLRLDARLQRAGNSAVAAIEAARSGAAPDPDGIERLARQLAERVESRLAARPAPAGERTVVLAPGLGGVLAHEIVGHALEADTVIAGRSWLASCPGPVAPGELRVLDDPRRARASWRFDDEGHPARATPLIRDGRVASWLHDARSAARSGCDPTGHGRRASYRDPARPRMGCTFMGAGRRTAGEILGGVADGIYVRRMEAARVDTRCGSAVFRVTDADRILGGALDRPLEPFLLHVDGRRTLSSLDQVADDLAFDTCVGSCHRDGQTLITSVGAPTICIGLATVQSRE